MEMIHINWDKKDKPDKPDKPKDCTCDIEDHLCPACVEEAFKRNVKTGGRYCTCDLCIKRLTNIPKELFEL